MKTLALRARVLIHCFLVFGYPGETLALVVHILHLNPRVVVSFFPSSGNLFHKEGARNENLRFPALVLALGRNRLLFSKLTKYRFDECSNYVST